MRACPLTGIDTFAPFNGKTAVYEDDVQSFSTVEPAIDLTASSPPAFAWQVRGTPPPAPGGGGPVTVVTVRFDDGNADQLNALNLLSARNIAATFYINSGFIGDSIHLSVADLQTLYAAGNEIGGPTIDHAKIKKLKTAAARYEVCTDRNTLLGCGFPVTSFAYPYGSYDAGSELVVHDCGYNSGRGVAGVDDTKTFAETMPPPDTYSMTVSDFTTFPDWLQGEVASGRVVVETTDQVIGGTVQPPVAP